MSYHTISVSTPQITYPIFIGADVFSNQELLTNVIRGQQVCIVTQENIAKHYLQPLKKALTQFQVTEILLPQGETAKNLVEWQKIMDMLLAEKYERSATLIALGGGVIGDITGFAAACYLRGVNYLQIPTSLMAQVDSAIGGKTGVNHALGKNLIGAFHQPRAVIADINMLSTLTQREFVSGLAEVIKYGLIGDAEFFMWLENHILDLMQREQNTLLYAVTQSAAAKAKIVSQDEKEQGLRSLLNLGHTFGHAIETACHYQTILHGEAVALGILMSARLSVLLNWLDENAYQRIFKLLAQCQLLHIDNLPAATDILQLMKQDKKVKNNQLNLIVLKRIGEAVMTSEINAEKIESAIEDVLKTYRNK